MTTRPSAGIIVGAIGVSILSGCQLERVEQ